MSKRIKLKHILWLFISVSIMALLAITCFLIVLEVDLPNTEALKEVHLEMPLRVFTSDGKLISEFGDIRRVPVSLKKVPQQMIQATLATEDQRFFSHSGVDFLGMGRAALDLIVTGKKDQGGSTITMQVARNFFLTRRKTYIRKIREILLALKIDHEFTKNQILNLYFNKIFYGSRAYGVAAAAKIYYGKNLNELTLPQIAMLAGLPKAPSTWNPVANPDEAFKRRNHVLERMLVLKMIDNNTYQSAISAPITAKLHDLQIMVKAPYIAEMVRQKMVKEYKDTTYTEGLDVYTTIDSKSQEAANHSIGRGLLAYDKRHGYRGSMGNVGQDALGDTDALNQMLSTMPTIGDISPAVITATDTRANSATALLKTGDSVNIPWSGIVWARWQIMDQKNDKESLGPSPKKVSQVLKPGDVVYVIQDSAGNWNLSQVPQAEAALVALDPHDGAIRSLVGGFNYFKSNFNRVTQAQRQPGSGFKPFIYSAALEKGFTLASMINDAPIAISGVGGENDVWRPENSDHIFYGPTPLKVAFSRSQNVATVRLLQSIGVDYARDYALRFGFDDSQIPNSLSLGLGTASVTPLQMAAGYSVFANGGYKITPYFIDHVNDYRKKSIYQAKPLQACTTCLDEDGANDDSDQKPPDNMAPRIITAQNAYLMNRVFHYVITNGTGRGALVLHRRDLGGKTGTTDHQKDGWFIGFNGDLVTTVWLGFDQSRSTYEYGARAALPIWIDFMRTALRGKPESVLPQPLGMVTLRIDPKTGLLAPANYPRAIFEVFRKEYAPTKMSDTKVSAENDSADTGMEQLY